MVCLCIFSLIVTKCFVYVLGLEDKASACEMLVCYARELKEGFAEYAEEVVKLMVPMLKFYFHDGVRTAAAQSMPCLLECAKIKGPQFLQGMWQYICPELLKCIDTEPETEVLTELMYSMSKVILVFYLVLFVWNLTCKIDFSVKVNMGWEFIGSIYSVCFLRGLFLFLGI